MEGKRTRSERFEFGRDETGIFVVVLMYDRAPSGYWFRLAEAWAETLDELVEKERFRVPPRLAPESRFFEPEVRSGFVHAHQMFGTEKRMTVDVVDPQRIERMGEVSTAWFSRTWRIAPFGDGILLEAGPGPKAARALAPIEAWLSFRGAR